MKLSDDKIICAHCRSPRVRYRGCTYGGYHYYYHCTECRKYTEHRYSLTSMRILYLVLAVLFISVIVFFFVLLDISPVLATAFSLAALFSGAVLSRKYRWVASQSIALDDLPDDRWIVPAANNKLRLAVSGMFVLPLFLYVVIFLLNLSRQ